MKQFQYEARNYLAQLIAAEEYAQFVQQEFVDVMQLRGHKVTLIADEIMLEQV